MFTESKSSANSIKKLLKWCDPSYFLVMAVLLLEIINYAR